jgi:hypothetical protein
MGFPFSDYVNLLDQCLAGRQHIVECLERQLFSARGKALAANADRESIADIFNHCFFEFPTLSGGLSGLQGKLSAAHLADGFEPARQDGYSRDLDAVELLLRAHHHWETTRWPGTNRRLVYSNNLYTVFMLRQLEHMSLRIWDEDSRKSKVNSPESEVDPPAATKRVSAKAGPSSETAERLQDVQRLLDLLNADGRSAGVIGPVRDVRWLIQTAQGPLTRHTRPYFIKAGNVSTLKDEARLEIHRAGAVLAGGHLRSQLRHLSRRTGWAFDDPQLVALTRSSNSMDMALLISDLVPLLEAYGAACAGQDSDARLPLADAILQGLSADPELLLTRLDLLGPSTMIEDLFLDRAASDVTSAASYTAVGEQHRACLARYGELVGRTAESLRQDSRVFDPAHAAYSPLGIVYGFCADLYSNMVLNTLAAPSSRDLSLEDLFNSRERMEEKQAQAHEWERLPKREGEPDPFEHSTEWAAQMYARLTGALEVRAAHPAEPNASRFRKASFYVVSCDVAIDSLVDGVLPAGLVSAQEHCLTSDVTRARAIGATALPADRLVADRAEGRFLACVRCEGAWFGVSKVPLTLFTSQGTDALITDVPPGVIDVLRQVCPELLVVIRGDGRP